MDFPQRVNGWALYAHPCFQETYDALVAEVETLKGKDPENYQRKAATKLLAVVHKVKWFTEFGHLNRGDMLTSEQHRCHNEKKKFQRRV